MSISSIKGEISYYEGLISETEALIEQLNTDIEELEALKGKYETLQSDFNDRQTLRKTGLKCVSSSTVENQIRPKYHDGMNDLLTGTLYLNVDEGLVLAISTISNEIAAKELEIEINTTYLESYRSSLSYWEDELEEAYAEEEAAKAAAQAGGAM